MASDASLKAALPLHKFCSVANTLWGSDRVLRSIQYGLRAVAASPEVLEKHDQSSFLDKFNFFGWVELTADTRDKSFGQNFFCCC